MKSSRVLEMHHYYSSMYTTKHIPLLSEKLERDWRRWGWPIVRKVDFRVRMPRGPPADGPWNEVAILDRISKEVKRVAQNYGESILHNGLRCP